MSDGRREVEIYIRTTPQALWGAITSPDKTRQYWFHALNHSTWAPGARWTSESEDGEVYLDGEIVDVEVPSRLVHTMHVCEGAAAAEPASTVAWDITPMGDACRLLLVNTDLGPETLDYVTGGWEIILSGLKTLLETGIPLDIGAEGSM
jgi:uncharacterized protein YndB with AHSA1/START domain